MKIASSIAFTVMTALAFSASADTYPVLAQFKSMTEELVSLTKAANSTQSVSDLAQKTRELIPVGVDIVKLYGKKNPVCETQYAMFLNELPEMEAMSLDDVSTRYHDGVGLPTAPKHCYLGRSQIVHPMMNLIRMKQVWDAQVRSDIIDDFEEVIEHIASIQKNLDNPPN